MEAALAWQSGMAGDKNRSVLFFVSDKGHLGRPLASALGVFDACEVASVSLCVSVIALAGEVVISSLERLAMASSCLLLRDEVDNPYFSCLSAGLLLLGLVALTLLRLLPSSTVIVEVVQFDSKRLLVRLLRLPLHGNIALWAAFGRNLLSFPLAELSFSKYLWLVQLLIALILSHPLQGLLLFIVQPWILELSWLQLAPSD